MGVSCIIKDCGNSRGKLGKEKRVMFHHLPSDQVMRKKWADSITNSFGFKKELKAIGAASCVCSEHFKESDYITGFTETRRLNYKCAIPCTTQENSEVKKTKEKLTCQTVFFEGVGTYL